MSTKFMKSAFVGWTFTAGLYYPPDFDSTKLMPLKMLRPKGQVQAMNIRMMFPFTMICDACGEYNYTGTKFTARVEDIKHEMYLGIKVYRFYGRCKHCWAEFTFKTDPKNSDYTMESGGKRTYEAWKDADMMESQLKAEKEREAEMDQMKALEQKSVDVQAEIQRIEDLDAIRTMNKRLGARDQTIEDALAFLFKKAEKEDKEDKAYLGEEDLGELEDFKQAQEERRIKSLDDAVDGDNEDVASLMSGSTAASSSSSSSSGAVAAANASAGEGIEGAGLEGKAKGLAAGSAIAAAVAERAKEQQSARKGAGALLSVKRKAPVAAAQEEVCAAPEKRPRTEAVVCAEKKATSDAEAGGAGGLGLGTYDSDSS